MTRDAYWRKCRVERVIDGDTCDLSVDLGYRLTTEQRIRLLGVDAPEMRGDEAARGMTAMLYVEGWFAMHAHQFSRWPYMVRTEKSDSFGRYLGMIECLEGHVLNDDIVQYGYAQLYTGRRA